MKSISLENTYPVSLSIPLMTKVCEVAFWIWYKAKTQPCKGLVSFKTDKSELVIMSCGLNSFSNEASGMYGQFNTLFKPPK